MRGYAEEEDVRETWSGLGRADVRYGGFRFRVGVLIALGSAWPGVLTSRALLNRFMLGHYNDLRIDLLALTAAIQTHKSRTIQNHALHSEQIHLNHSN